MIVQVSPPWVETKAFRFCVLCRKTKSAFLRSLGTVSFTICFVKAVKGVNLQFGDLHSKCSIIPLLYCRQGQCVATTESKYETRANV